MNLMNLVKAGEAGEAVAHFIRYRVGWLTADICESRAPGRLTGHFYAKNRANHGLCRINSACR